VLELYDPDRVRFPVERPEPAQKATYAVRTWDEFLQFARQHLDGMKAEGGQGLAVLAGASSSPSLAAVRERWRKTFPRANWYEYEPISRDNEREGTRAAFGRPMRMQLDLGKADIVVSLGAICSARIRRSALCP